MSAITPRKLRKACSVCGGPTTAARGVCQDCRPKPTEHVCGWCGRKTIGDTGSCNNCQWLDKPQPDPEPGHGLPNGAWVTNHRGIAVWVPAADDEEQPDQTHLHAQQMRHLFNECEGAA